MVDVFIYLFLLFSRLSTPLPPLPNYRRNNYEYKMYSLPPPLSPTFYPPNSRSSRNFAAAREYLVIKWREADIKLGSPFSCAIAAFSIASAATSLRRPVSLGSPVAS